MTPRLSRRAFLRGAGGVAVGLPFLGSLHREARAGGDFPQRFLVFFSPNGTIHDQWVPSGSENDFELSRILAPLERHKSNLLILDGIDMESAYHGPGDGHQTGMAHMLTATEIIEGDTGGHGMGWGGGISIDQELARNIGTQTRFASLELGVQTGFGELHSRMCYLGANQPLPPEDDPARAFDRIFAGFDPGPGQPQGPSEADRLRARRRSILDAVMGDYERLSGRVGREDRVKLEQHLTSIREIEQRLGAPGPETTGGSCSVPNRPGVDQSDFEAVGRAHMDMLAMALACDLTRVGSLQWSISTGQTVFSWLGIGDGHHDISHEGDDNAGAVENLVLINTWYAEQFAYLLDRLDELPEGDGTVLDNTVVFWCNELGKGNEHTRRQMPFVLAGGGAGLLRPGRFLSYQGEPHNKLYVALLQQFGIDTDTFGNSDYGSGPLTGLG